MGVKKERKTKKSKKEKKETETNDDDENETNDDDENTGEQPKCDLPEIQKITSSTSVDKMLDYILDAIIVTLHRPTIKLDDILDKIFEIIEAVLNDCGVKKGSLGLTTAAKVPMITTCLQTTIPTKYIAKMVIVAHKILSPQGFKKYKDKLICLVAMPKLESQYADLKKNLKSKLDDSFDKIKEEAFSYLATGVKFMAKSTVGPMIEAQKTQIINEIVRMSKKMFDELDPMIKMIIKAQKNKKASPEQMLQMLQTQFNQMKGGKRKTRKHCNCKTRKHSNCKTRKHCILRTTRKHPKRVHRKTRKH